MSSVFNRNSAIKAAAALSVGGAAYIALGWSFFRFITFGGKAKPSETRENKENRKKWFSLKHTSINHPTNGFEEEYNAVRSWCEAQPMKDWYIRSRDGLKLHASYYPVDDAKRFVILCHGYRGTRFGSVASIARFLREQKCSLLFIDQRCCGESEGEYITYGAKEQYDIINWILRVRRENKANLPIYLYGQSMGATSVLLASGHWLPKEVKGIIADCGFSSMKEQIRDVAAGWFHLRWPGLLLMRTDLYCRVFAGFAMKKTDTTDALKKNRRPILFFHGSEDTYVWPHNTMRNYERCRAEKEMVIVPGARHLCSIYVDPGLYREKVLEFFKKHDG